MGPSLGAWLTETYSWHWVFFVNLPFGAVTVLGLAIFMRQSVTNAVKEIDPATQEQGRGMPGSFPGRKLWPVSAFRRSL